MPKVYLSPLEQPVENAAIYFDAGVDAQNLRLNGLSFKAVNEILDREVILSISGIGMTIPSSLLLESDADTFTPPSDRLTFDLPGGEVSTGNGVLELRWAKLRLTQNADKSYTIDVQGLEISSRVVPFVTISGDLTLSFNENGALTNLRWLCFYTPARTCPRSSTSIRIESS